jgi:hypothetical protein
MFAGTSFKNKEQFCGFQKTQSNFASLKNKEQFCFFQKS